MLIEYRDTMIRADEIAAAELCSWGVRLHLMGGTVLVFETGTLTDSGPQEIYDDLRKIMMAAMRVAT